MSDNKNPFADFEPIFKQMQVPGLDMEAMMDAYRKNLEALTAASRASSEGMQGFIQRQAEIIRDALAQMRNAATELSSAKDPKDFTERQAELTKQAFEKAVANMKELAEVMAKSNTDSLEIVQTRMNEGLKELQDMMNKVVKT
ncbi:phasin family protein [Thiocystis violacea]|uniref:phasin family protein n=1 Tax=Thiocystis violacea TaxID=13725 RepID=UPI001903509E|nr:phasin family protein [Thiocystis violacea]